MKTKPILSVYNSTETTGTQWAAVRQRFTFTWDSRPAGQEVLGSDDDINGANDDTVRPSTPGPIQEDVMVVLLNCLPS